MAKRTLPDRDWHHTKVKAISEIADVYFYQLLPFEASTDFELVPLSKVVGTTNQAHYNGTWSAMFYGNLPLNRGNILYPTFIASPDTKTLDITFQCVEDEYFIYEDGNHRTCILKFEEERPYIKVKVTRWRKDKQVHAIYRYLKSQQITIDLHEPNEHNQNWGLEYIANPHWTVSLLGVEIQLKGREAIIEFYNYYQPLQANALSLFKAKLLSGPLKPVYNWPVDAPTRTNLTCHLLHYKHALVARL